jgi:FKBP-type peptidyl-prolyl cis-trans isomerase
MGAKEDGIQFLEDNLKVDGVQVTQSGLQYKVVEAGSGAKPKATDTVEVNYRGTFIDGKQFDSSYDRGQTIEFPLNGVIGGWTEGLQLMSIGATYQFYIPFHLAYGERGAGGAIPPFSTLIFDVELVAIK